MASSPAAAPRCTFATRLEHKGPPSIQPQTARHSLHTHTRYLYRYFRDRGKVIKDLKQHRMWVMLEAGSGIVSQHDYDPESSCEGWNGCR